ncbi:phage tail tape measure protein [Campylobacter sp. 7477a]|uniref:phage tail tape measure protein n=1 Tax=Campylobacter sp. 7477a TaxID=2735741 RepID=UPI0030143DA7|nr:phage tail tape measure protein [Campylobacter sp. 7477a]
MDNTQIGILIGLKTSGFSVLSGNITKLNKLSQSLANAGKNVTELNEKIKKIEGFKANIDTNISKIGEQFNKWQSTLATAASFAVPVKFAIDDEAAFADVKKYVDDTDENLNTLKNKMRELSNAMGKSFAEIANIAVGGGKINLKGDELIKYTQILSTGATAFEMSTEALSRASNNMKVGFKMNDLNRLNDFFDRVNLLDNKVTNANASDIFEATSLTAATASMINLNATDAAAFSSTMLSSGKAVSVVGTSLNALYSKLSMAEKNGKAFQDALAGIGMDANYLKNALAKDATGAITQFLEAISKADKDKQTGLLYDLVGGNFNDEIAGLVNNIDELKANIKTARSDEAKGSMHKELQTKLNTTKSALERLAQAWRNIGATIGEAFLPTLNFAIKSLNALASGINAFIQKSPNLSKLLFGITGGILAFITLAPAVKILALSFGIAWQQVKILGTAVSFLASVTKLQYLNTLKLNAAYLYTATSSKIAASATFVLRGALNAVRLGIMAIKWAFVSTGIGAIVVLLGSAAAYVMANWDELRAKFARIWEGVKPYWQATTQFFSDIWQGVSSFISGIFDPVIAWWNSLFGGFFDWIADKFGWVSDMIKSVSDGLGTAWSKTKEFLGSLNPFSDDETSQSVQSSKASSGGGFFSSFFGGDEAVKATQPATQKHSATAAVLSGGGAINIAFNGDFLLNSNNGKFDLESFKAQITQGVKDALRRDEMNAKNRSIIGQ